MPAPADNSPRAPQNLVWRIAAALLGVAMLGWLTLSVGVATVSARTDPDLALKFRAHDARANARKAELTMTIGMENPQARENAEAAARRALDRDATSVVAWRVLGLASGARRDAPLANRYFGIVERLSRRDLPTQLWLIEKEVGENQVKAALKHYDAALRISSSSHDMLLPVLVSATSDPSIVEELARILRKNPWWRRAFIGRLADNPVEPAQAVRLIRLIASNGQLREADLVRFMITRMVEKHAVSDAWQLYALLRGNPNLQPAPLRDGEFTVPDPITPFEWQLEGNADLGAEQQSSEDAGSRGSMLHVYARNGSAGFVARQLTILPPGIYALAGSSVASDGADSARLYWTVVCDGASTSLNERDIGAAPAQTVRWQGSFTVPTANCPAQWLLLGIRSDTQAREVEANVDAITLGLARQAGPAAAAHR